MSETFFYTCCSGDKIFFEPKENDVLFKFPTQVSLDNQQMLEFGGLLIALSLRNGKELLDLESVGELLDGYGLKLPE